jgi:hypothetical protein
MSVLWGLLFSIRPKGQIKTLQHSLLKRLGFDCHKTLMLSKTLPETLYPPPPWGSMTVSSATPPESSTPPARLLRVMSSFATISICFPSRVTPSAPLQLFHLFYILFDLKVPSGQIGSALDWYHWKGLEKDINRYRFLIF